MERWGFKSFLFYCGIGKEAYTSVRPLIWERNKRTVRITALLSGSMAGVFFVINLIRKSDVLFPYIFLFFGSLLILSVWLLIRNRKAIALSQILCYAEMAITCVYASLLSSTESNYAVPATSVIVFIALLPQSIDDRPVRMYLFMTAESVFYLFFSYFKKSPEVFSLDLINTVTFCVIGMILYSVICSRNVREIYQSIRVENIQRNTVSTLATVVEERDENTGGHIQRTVDYVEKLAERMKTDERYAGCTSSFYRNVVLAAPMHDIGKIKIPDAILNKPAKLDPDEYELMKKHAAYGADIIDRTMSSKEEQEYHAVAFNIARYHHERYDGTGYPEGLKGEEIPLEARIMALADVYDALVSDRVYKKAYPKEEAERIIREGVGTQFDPELGELFLAVLKDEKESGKPETAG
ncbi:MAG: HD domain-containing protein [Clostridia bacterium]|nr:HD domain-containing protein [Clostridia bacterium]